MSNMKKNPLSRFAFSILMPAVSGATVGVLIFLFKISANAVIDLSGSIYDSVNAHPVFFSILVCGAAMLGIFASLILKYAPDGKGGGIPTAVTVLRGLVDFSWIKSIISMFTSAMLTYFCGVPLGNEGPSVQMGTAVGRGYVRALGKDAHAWDRYIMTGGACAGFAAATGAPLAGIFFAFEEAHRRFSPLIFITSAISTTTSCAVMKLLCTLTSTPYNLFSFESQLELPLGSLWAAAALGLICGVISVVFARAYRSVRKILNNNLSSVPFFLRMALIFAVTAVFGLFSDDFVGSGHHLTEELFAGHSVWYMLVLCFAVRAVLLLFANNIGVTGGLFVPTLTFGAIIGSLGASFLKYAGLVEESYYSVFVVIGIAAFLSSFSHTPVMAIAFSLEVMSGAKNILPIIAGVAVSYVVAECIDASPFTDAVIEAKVEDSHRGREAVVVDTQLTVREGSFIVDKEIRDVLWPPSCVITFVHKSTDVSHRVSNKICEGDRLDVHYSTYDPDRTELELESYVGEQDAGRMNEKNVADKNDSVPEI